jgi:hypothetical protein
VNCFDWNNRASDYLDGTLMGAVKAEADQHLDSCRECSERFKHYRIILSSISARPRATLPIPIRKFPLVSGLPRLSLRISRSRWDHIPWYLRTSIEGVGIVFMILLGISTGPKLRSVYERSMESNLEEFTQSFREWRESRFQATEEEAPLTRGKSLGPASVTEGASPDAQKGEELISGDSDSEGDSTSDTSDDDEDDATVVEGGGGNNDTSDIRVGANEIWRFMLKTDSPHEMRPKIVKILTALQIPATTRGIGGIEAPGGIQFDLLVSPEIISDIKHELQAIAPKPPAELEKSPAGQTFTWYKNKSKTKLPDHKTRVVIWLSQM